MFVSLKKIKTILKSNHMKKLIFLVCLFFVKAAFAQKQDTTGLHIPYANGVIVYEKIFNAPGKTQAVLYNNARAWFIENARGVDSIQLQDSLNSRIIAKGLRAATFKGMLDISINCKDHYVIQIDCKDGKYRCRITNINMECISAGTIFVKPEDLVQQLLGQKSNANFNNNQAKRALVSLDEVISSIFASVDKTVNDNDNF
jgi:hypothetical protein